ncbi:MAG: hypothetical protein ACOC83_09110 [Gemmatimonadota bacterium]
MSVRLEGGGTHRIRVDGAALQAGTPDEAERQLRDRMAARGALAVEGLDGVSLHLDASRVRAVRAEGCRAMLTP